MRSYRKIFFSRPLSVSARRDGGSYEAGAPPKPFSEIPGGARYHVNTSSNAEFFQLFEGVSGQPIVGCVPMLFREIKKGVAGDDSIFHKLHLELGPIYKIRMFGNDDWQVHTSSPEDAETMSRAEGKYPSRGIFEDNLMWVYKKINLPTPMVFLKGEEWKKTRSAAAKQVVPRRVGNFVGPLCGIAEELLDHLEDIMDESGNIPDITPELAKWAFQGVSYFVYGEKIDVYSDTDPLQREFIEAGLAYINNSAQIITALPFYKLFPTKPYRDYVRIVRRMQAAGKQVLERRYDQVKEAIASGVVDESKAVGLLDQWLIEGKFTEEEALSQSYEMLSAGIDTTKNSAAFLLYELARRPEVQDQLVQEISSVVGEKEHPTWEDLQKMTLVRNCLKETQRLYVPTGVHLRVLSEDAVLGGYLVPAGTKVAFDLHTASRDESVFKDPQKFKLERWNKDNFESTHPFSSLPFGFGPRACYGRRLAELEIYILLAKLLPEYEILTNVKDVKLKKKAVLSPDVPLHINLQKRKALM